MWSGDTVVADEEGFLYFVGRTDDMIKTSGYRVSPTEIEEVAYDTGLVRDAVALGVAGRRGSGSGSCSSSAAAARAFDADRAARGAAPAAAAATWCRRRSSCATELPRSPNGKFDRVLLREELTRA